MVRMSDLARGGAAKPPAEPDRPAPPGGREDTPAEGTPPAGSGGPGARPRPPRPARLSLRALVEAGPSARPSPPATETPGTSPEAPDREPADVLFADLQVFLERLRGLVKGGGPLPWGDLERRLGRIVQTVSESGELFWVAHGATPPPEVDAVAFHQARVAVFTVRIGAGTGLEPKRLVELGLAAAVIDIGLWAVADGRRLDPASAEYRAHPRTSAEIIRASSPPSDVIAEAVLQHHELEHGQGFPQGLKRDAIHPYAKILALVDRYAALTGSAAGRARGRPHEVIRDIVRSKSEEFAPALVKVLLAEVSIFPPGTPVRLNTGETGRVVGVNRSHPLRPRVEVVADAKGNLLASPRTVDLSETPFLYVAGPPSESR